MKPSVITPSSPGRCAFWATGALLCFQLAYSFSGLRLLILAYTVFLLGLAGAASSRQAFYFGLVVALVNAALQMNCLWTIFGWMAIVLWLVLAFWTALFTALAQGSLNRFGSVWGALLLPFLWTGLEYFRSELYYLRFSWLNLGYALSDSALLPLFRHLGVYGVGFCAVAFAAIVWFFRPRNTSSYAVLFAFAPALLFLIPSLLEGSAPERGPARSVRVAGLQLEFPIVAEVISALDNLIRKEADAELVVLSEYTFDGEVPETIKNWCRKNRRYLVVGGKDPAANAKFYDTAFVIDPTGEIVFHQAKSVPIQFFNDGLPAAQQRLWESPWGKFGICICYDLSYTRVTDRLVRLGAQAIVVPTMDVADWGRRQHELHALVAPVRSAEYGIPILRVASSGFSQLVGSNGKVISSAGFPGQHETVTGVLSAANRGSRPLDRWLAPAAVFVTAMVMVLLLVPRRTILQTNEARPNSVEAPALP